MSGGLELSDEGLKYLILGAFRGSTVLDSWPIKMRGVIDNFDDQGDIQSFSIVTESGLKYTVSVTFDGQLDQEP